MLWNKDASIVFKYIIAKAMTAEMFISVDADGIHVAASK